MRGETGSISNANYLHLDVYDIAGDNVWQCDFRNQPNDLKCNMFTNLSPDATYSWKAYYRCSSADGTSNYGSETIAWSFTAGSAGTIPSVPVLLSLERDQIVSLIGLVFEWSAVEGAIGYFIHFTDLETGYRNFANSPTASWAFPVSEGETRWFDTTGPNYEWYVVAYNDYSVGESSEVWRFVWR